METAKPKKISRTQKENMKIAKEMIENGEALEMKFDDTPIKDIDNKKIDLIKAQKDYRLGVKDYENAVAGLNYQRKNIEFCEAELTEFKIQANVTTMLWNGIIYPKELLLKLIEVKEAEVDSYRTAFNRNIEKFVDITNDMQTKKDELKNKFKLTEEEITGIMDGKYVKEPKN